MPVSASDYCCRVSRTGKIPIYALSLPNVECDYDELLPDILKIIDSSHDTRSHNSPPLEYQLLLFCAGGRHRPSWPWLIHAFSSLEKRFKKGLRKLYLVHEKSWVRVCMQLLENVVSPKFGRKIFHLRNLEALGTIPELDFDLLQIPQEAREYDRMLLEDDTHLRKRQDRKRSSKRRNESNHKADMAVSRSSTQSEPPAVPAPRTVAKSNTRKAKSDASKHELPVVPPRRAATSSTTTSTSTTTESLTSRTNSHDMIIFEDPDEDLAAEQASANLQQILLRSVSLSQTSPDKSTCPAGLRSASAPHTGPGTTRAPRAGTQSGRNVAKAPTVLRRAISGPLTPSSSTKQNYLPPVNQMMPPPKINIRGRDVTVQVRKVGRISTDGGKVDSLKALFEQKAMVAQSMS